VEKYFPSWRWRDLITQFGSSGEAPQALIDAVRMWEHLECGRAEDMRVPHAPRYREAIAEWERTRDASRVTCVRRPKGKPESPPSVSASTRAPYLDSNPPEDGTADAPPWELLGAVECIKA
jgi:hypothetical protein